MSASSPNPDLWRRSSRCLSSGCVEVRLLDGRIAVRDSKVEAGPVLTYTAEEWLAFIEGVKAGEFDDYCDLAGRLPQA